MDCQNEQGFGIVKESLQVIAIVGLSIGLFSACNPSPDTEPEAVAQGESETMQQNEPQPAEEVMIPATNYYKISTRLGDMTVMLYDETPGHRDNFKKLVAEGFYDNTTFHRVIEDFMIQGGDPNSKDDDPTNDGQGGPGYTIPAEFVGDFFHKKGALAAARTPDQFNPERRSSGSQFYIVKGQTFDAATLDRIEQQIGASIPGFSYSDEARAVYLDEGGYPPLDGQYTVYGEIVEGFDVLDKISATTTGVGDRPTEDIRMTIEALENYEPANQE